MILYAFLILILSGCFAAITNWRYGIFFLILVAAIQDPIRKMVPGSPGYLVLSTMPIWFAMLVGAFPVFPNAWQVFEKQFRRLSFSVRLFILSLLPAALISATYGPNSWMVTVVGILSYSCLLLGVLTGYLYPRKNNADLRNILKFYCIITAVMLIGTPLDYLNIFPGWKALGASAMGTEWRQTSIYGTIVEMIAGFYRSPDVMGWHAVTLIMFSILLAIINSGTKRYFWLSLAGWGVVGVMLCGRRKMLYILPVFGFVLIWLVWRSRNVQLTTIKALFIIVLCVGAGYSFYQYLGPSSAVETYYFHNPNSPFERVGQHGFKALLTTYNQYGFWGAGLGSATQGIHHLNVAKPRTWQEGGLGRILVELGVPGFFCFLYMGFALISVILKLGNSRLNEDPGRFVVRAGLIAMIFGNAGSFVVSHQIFGDPFVITFFAFTIGLVLSGAREAPVEGHKSLFKLRF